MSSSSYRLDGVEHPVSSSEYIEYILEGFRRIGAASDHRLQRTNRSVRRHRDNVGDEQGRSDNADPIGYFPSGKI
ncbi:hypothetical protein [Gordonia sp. (in: high G+C Gram-positive bacteria)]|uniref:hypothetical protein n=1 Tax=Gordonia sp. (in: high G+C Gram-positive bacteria) TaxID=84139 RepID=UPI001E082FCE|nr:hypothetical protein [Gordonia sp. (in: high G+C Gram-positive bacteria)]MCB1294867.1 hypothetical protein [Gordonia sp. (in: high G+C Gram-positive bacteria)]HMS74530.1 hypothetical protein [Gordonia sp. (in: high G+C Gram-positive bacteria)]